MKNNKMAQAKRKLEDDMKKQRAAKSAARSAQEQTAMNKLMAGAEILANRNRTRDSAVREIAQKKRQTSEAYRRHYEAQSMTERAVKGAIELLSEQRKRARADAARLLTGTVQSSIDAAHNASKDIAGDTIARKAKRENTAFANTSRSAQGMETGQQSSPHAYREMAELINQTGRLPVGYHWQKQGDKSVAIRDLAHKPLEGVNSTILQYYDAAQQANEKYGKQYGQKKAELEDLNASYEYAKQVVERGNNDPAYAEKHPEYYLLTSDDPNQNLSGYEKLLAQKQQELDRLNTEFNKVDALRPADMEGMTVRDSTRMQGAYYQRPSVWNDPVLSPVIDTVDGAYQMLTGGQSLKSIAQDEAENGKEGVGFLRSLGAGAVMAGNQLNDTLLGIAENAVDLTGSWLGRKIDPNWENPITKLREGNQQLGYAAYGDELENATGGERVLMNVTSSGLNSAAHMALGGMLGKGMGLLGGGGTMPTAMQAARAQGMTGFGNMGSFTLGAMTDAYDRAEADGSPAYMRPIRAIAAGMGSMIANSDNTEKFMQRMGIGAGMDKTGISNFVGTKMYSKWGDAAMNWAADTFGDQALSEGTQEVVEKIIDRTLDAGFTGNLLNAEYWDGFADELGEDFFYGYLSGALYNTMALPNYAPSNQMLNSMVTGETETTPETMVRWFEQVATDMADPEMQRIAQQATHEMQNTGDVQAAKTGVVERMLTAADALVAKQEQKSSAEAAVPEIQADEEGVSRFERPMAATVIDAEDGSGEVQVVGFETTQDGRNVVLHTVDAQGNRGTAMAGELNFADDTVQQLMTADDAKNLSGESLQSYLRDYASEVDGHSVTPEEYARGYGMVYRRAAAGMDMADAIRNSVIPQVMTQSAMQDAYASGLGAGAATQESVSHSPTSATNGVMNRSFTTGAWNSMTRQQQRVAAANMEVVSALAKRMGATINIVDSITDSAGNRANGRYNAKTGQIDIALNADANAYAYVAMHELTHQLKDQHGKSWDTFAGWVKEALTDKGQDFEKLVKYQMDSFGLSREDAAEEVICNTVPAMLQDEGTLQKLYEQDRTLFEKLMDWLKNLISDVKAAGKALSERSQSWKQMGALKEDAATLQGLYDVMESIMQSEGEAASGNSGTKSSPKTASFAEHKLFSGLVDKLRQLNPDSYITVGTIEKGSPLEQVGIPNGKLYFDVSKALKELDKHGDHLSEKVYKEIPSLLANPIAITQYKDNTVSVYGHLIHNGTTPIVVGVMIAKDRSGTASIAKIRTVHARGDYRRQITDDSVLYLNPNKKETSAWFQALGIRVPLGGKRFGFIRSIAGDTQNVKYSDTADDKRNRFSMSDMVEETRDLIAVHNLTEQNLKDTIELGGFAMPSIAVIKAEQGHSEYGPISVVFAKDTIDPERSRDNEVYGSDAWTPTFPRIDYEASEDVEDRIRHKWLELREKVGEDAARPLYGYANYLQDQITNKGGIDQIISDYEDDPKMMNLFLADTADPVKPITVRTVSRMDDAIIAQSETIVKMVGKDALERFTPFSEKSWMDHYGDRLKEAYAQALKDAGLDEDIIQAVIEEANGKNLRRALRRAVSYMANNGETITESTDFAATNEAIRNATNKQHYKKWLEDLFAGAIKRKGIRNDKDIFTPSGNRRSFAATHWDVTLENVVKAMRREEKIGVGTIGGRNLEGAAVKKYKNINDIKKDSGRLGMIEQDAHEAKRREFRERFQDLVESYAGSKSYDDAAEVLVEAVAKYSTVSGMYRYIQQYDTIYRPHEWIAEELHELVEEMKNQPTGYFEAKPRRAVGFDEAAAFIVPDNLSDSIRTSLEEMGANIVEYKAGDEEDRKAKLNGDGVEKLKFSLSDYDDTVREGENVLEELLTMTAAHRMTDAEAARVARKVLKAASSEMELEEATQRIKSIFDYASRSGDKLDMYGLSSEATALADDMLSQSKTLDMQHEDEVADLRYYLKHNQISLSTEQQKEAANLMGGSYSAYRKALFGRVNLNRNGSALDGAVWEQLHEAAPHLFPLDATSGDQVRLLMEAAEYVQPVYHNESGLDAREAAQWLTHELFNAYMSLSGVQSAAKEQNRLGLKLRQYRQVADRFAKEHKAAFDEAYAKVTKEAGAQIAAATEKAERRADKAISEAEADADLRVAKAQAGVEERIADAKQQNLADMEAYRDAMREKAKTWRSEFVTKHRDAERKNRYRAQILRETNQLLKKVEKPTDTHHVQDELTGALTTFLKSLDLGRRSKERSIGDRILSLRNVMQDAANGEGGRSFLVDSDILESMRFMAEQLQGMDSLDQLTADQMEQVRNIVHCAVWTVNKADTTFADRKAMRISAAAGRFLQEAGEREDWKDRGKIVNWARNFLTVRQMDSMHFFDKLGGAAKEMYQSLRDGLDKKTMHRANAMDYVAEAVSKIPEKERADLFAGEKAAKTRYELTGGSIELTRAQVMELYCLNKREQARGHLYDENVGGIRAGDNQNARAVKVQPADIDKLIGTLTAEEKALANALQAYMVDECAKWGNETSMTLYGYKKFGEKNYYPIRVDPDSVDSNISQEGQQDNLYAIANMGMTKALKEKAKNALYIGDIFDTFSRHVDNMATYNAYAAPIADLVRWYNYRPGDGSSVKKMIQSKFGKEAAEYIPRLIRDLNGEVNRSYSPNWAEKMTGLMKSSSVGRNIRVSIQQPTAILRAGDMMDYRYISQGMTGLTGKGGKVKLKEAIELSKQHCPIAMLKSMGFFETDMGKSLRAAMFDNRSVLDKIKDEGMWLPGKMDEMTFGTIWRACEAETRKLKPELAVGSDAYYKAVGKRMSEIIDYTQVVDTPFHRTQLMRNGDGLTKMATSFMSEPSKTYNMLASAMQRLKENRHDPVAKRKFCRALGAFGLNAVVNAAAQSLIDAMRDGEDEEFWAKWGKAMFGDWSSCEKFMDYVRTALDANSISGLNPLSLIPYIKDVLSMVQGYDVKRTDMQSMEKLMQVGTNVGNLINGKNKLSGWGWARQIATAVDSVTGQSFGNALRDGYSFANLILKAIGLDPISEKTEVASTSIAYDNLYDAMLDGDAKKWSRVSKQTGTTLKKTEKEIDAAMATHFAEDAAEQVVTAYTAKQEGKASEYNRIRSRFVDEYGEVLGENGSKRAEEIFDKSVAVYANDQESEEEEVTASTPLNSKAWSYTEAASVVQGYANGTCSKEDIALVRSEMIADSTAKNPQTTVDTSILKQVKKLYIAAGPEERKRLGEAVKELFGKDDKYLANWLK